MRSIITGLFAAITILGTLPEPSVAGNSWMSGVRPGGGASLNPSFAPSSRIALFAAAAPVASNDSATSVFDVLVSLYNDPSGDDDPDNDTGSEEQTKYEDVIRHWADSVCEQTNGAHHLGKVRIFRKGLQQSKADVVWVESCHPSANPSGFGVDQRRINMCDKFTGGCGTGCDLDFLGSAGRRQDAGYTLGHEWGHYVYGVFDEYRGSSTGAGQPAYWPRNTDAPTDPSIMNSQWNARTVGFEWLNHSTSDNIGDVTKTGQGRTYGKSGWEVLVQPTSDDPKTGDKTAQPARTRFTGLDAVKPAATDNWVKEELPGDQASCRTDLDIIWMQDELAIEIVLDRSGSMGSQSKMANAKQAAKNLVDVSPDGSTAVGVVAFSGSPSVIMPVTDIPDPGAAVKATIKATIDPIFASGGTNMYTAASLALNELLAYEASTGSDAAKVTYLLSDGVSSGAFSAPQVIASYNAADAAIITFSYGSDADINQLKALSDGTGGQFYNSPVALAEIQAAFLAASAATGSTQTLIQGVPSTTDMASGSSSLEFPVDSTISALTLLINHRNALSSLSFSVQGPQGSGYVLDVAPANCEAIGSEVSCTQTIDDDELQSAGVGNWTVVGQTSSGVGALDWSLSVVAAPAEGGTYDLSVASLDGSTVSYPRPIVIQSMLGRGSGFVRNLGVSATITAPSGAVSVIPLNDIGSDGDAEAADGIYSAVFLYDENGTHSIRVAADNGAGIAEVTNASFQISATESGEEPAPLPPTPVTENLVRVATTQITVQGVVADDHPNQGPGTAMSPDNVDVPGLIDYANDVDYFLIQNVDLGSDLVVRVTSLSAGMAPELSVYMPDGTAVATGDLNSAQSAAGYIALTIPANQLDTTMWAAVRHLDSGADTGGYDISAGSAIVSDTGVTLPGDLDGDGEVDVQDIRIARRLARSSSVPTAAELDAADLDGDGKITARDLALMIRLCAPTRCRSSN
jgi:calcium-activated chloride channel regulator 3/4